MGSIARRMLHWICWTVALVGVALAGRADAATPPGCTEAALEANHAVAVALEVSPQMDAAGTPFNTRRRDAELLIAALSAAASTPTIVTYGTAEPITSAAAALAAAERALAARPAQRRTLALITADAPVEAPTVSSAADRPLLVLALSDSAALVAWAERAGATYLPLHAPQARELQAQWNDLAHALRTNQPAPAPVAAGCTTDSPQALTPQSGQAILWSAFGLGGLLLSLAAVSYGRSRRNQTPAPEPTPTEGLRTARHASPRAAVLEAHAAEHADGRHAGALQTAPIASERPMTERGGVKTGSPQSAVRCGTRIGPYRVLRKLGVGGQATSYLALSPGLRMVTLKTAHIGAATPLYDEHAWLNRPGARHPHLRQAAPYPAHHTLGMMFEPHGRRTVWIALAYAPGQPLTKWRLRVDQAIQVALQAAEALDHLHRVVGIVHQDVTPANLIVQRRWNGALHTRLIDLSAADEPAAPRNRTGYGVGAYMAPERLHSPAAPPDAQSDIFALGMVLRTLVADRPISAHLADLIAAMTQPDVAQRRAALPTMADVAARLRQEVRRSAVF